MEHTVSQRDMSYVARTLADTTTTFTSTQYGTQIFQLPLSAPYWPGRASPAPANPTVDTARVELS